MAAGFDYNIDKWDYNNIFYSFFNGDCHPIMLKDGKIAAGYNDNSEIWEITSRTMNSDLYGGKRPYRTILLRDGYIASCSGDSEIKIWNLEKKKFANVLRGQESKYETCLNLMKLFLPLVRKIQSKFGIQRLESVLETFSWRI